MSEIFDFIIIGSGFGGLACANMLSKNGYKVCVVEQGALLGGCFQSFRRKNRYIDTGIHYVGSLKDGQIMNQYLKYFGILDDVEIAPLDDEFDVINLAKDGVYSYYQTYDNFKKYLKESFPSQKSGIDTYCEKISQLGASINIEAHSKGKFSDKARQALEISADEFIKESVSDPVLQKVLAGTNPLYAGNRSASNLYHHAMINHSNIEGASRFVGNSQKVVDLMSEKIKSYGSVLLNNSRVEEIKIGEDGNVKYISLANKEKLFAKNFISNIHPANTLALIDDTPFIKKAYRSRFASLENTYGIFSLYLMMKENAFKYMNKNIYFYTGENVWDCIYDTARNSPREILMMNQNSGGEYAKVISVMSLIDNEIFKTWQHDKNYSSNKDYCALKQNISDVILDYIAKYIPDIKESVECVYTSSPLTYKRYIGSMSAYGILKDYKTSMLTLLSSKTKIKNLYITGQNLNVHGAIGVAISSAMTCSEFLGKEFLLKEIAKA